MNSKTIIKEIQIEFCKKCESLTGKKDVDVCFECKWHKYFNDLYDCFNGEK